MEKKDIKEQVKKKVEELDAVEIMKDLVKDNKKEFIVGEITYRVRILTGFEKEQARKERSKKLKELLDNSDWLLRQQLIDKYKLRGVDIDGMKSKIKKLDSEKEALEIRLLEISDKKAKEEFEQKIIDIKNRQIEIMREINDLLDDSLEDELSRYGNSYVLWLSLEKKEGDNWVRAFNGFDEFLNVNNDDLIMSAGYYYMALGLRNNEV